MLYNVSRAGQNYGPYTLEDLQRYVASGNVLPSDLAKSDDMPDWVPVSQVLGIATPPATPPAGYAAPPSYSPAIFRYPDPPNLHWALVLVIGMFTCGIFFIVWDFVQAAWMRRVNPRSNALFFYIGENVVGIGGGTVRSMLMFSGGIAGMMHHQHRALGFVIWLIAFTLLELARFDMHRSMEEHFNGPEPVGLSLNGAMTFFFGSLYFQYHFTRINELKRLARYRGAAI